MSLFVINVVDEESAILYKFSDLGGLSFVDNLFTNKALPQILLENKNSIVHVFAPGNMCVTNIDELPKLSPLDVIRLINLRNSSFASNFKLWGYQVNLINRRPFLYQIGIGSKLDKWIEKLSSIKTIFHAFSSEITRIAELLTKDSSSPIIISYISNDNFLKIFGISQKGLTLYREISVQNSQESTVQSHIDESVKYLSRKYNTTPVVFALNKDDDKTKDILGEKAEVSIDEALLEFFVKKRHAIAGLTSAQKKLPANLNFRLFKSSKNTQKLAYAFIITAVIAITGEIIQYLSLVKTSQIIEAKTMAIDSLLNHHNVAHIKTAVNQFKTIESQNKTPKNLLKRLDLVLSNNRLTLEDLNWDTSPGNCVCEIGLFIGDQNTERQEIHDSFENLVHDLNEEFGKDNIKLVKAPLNMAENSVFMGGNFAEEASIYAKVRINENPKQ